MAAHLLSLAQLQQLISHCQAHVHAVCSRLMPQGCKVLLGILHAILTCIVAVKMGTADSCLDLKSSIRWMSALSCPNTSMPSALCKLRRSMQPEVLQTHKLCRGNTIFYKLCCELLAHTYKTWINRHVQDTQHEHLAGQSICKVLPVFQMTLL